MAYENNAGLGVHNHYAARTSGGTQGVNKTEGRDGEFVWDLGAGLAFTFPTNVEVTGVDETFLTAGNVTALTIGDVAVIDASEAAPVGIIPANTGVLAQTGGTSGTIVIKYKMAPAGRVVVA